MAREGEGMGGMGKDGREGEERKGERERKAGRTVPPRSVNPGYGPEMMQPNTLFLSILSAPETVSREHQSEIAYGISNDHVSDDVIDPERSNS